jgi:8-oxo-dGTP pyrophosphatase MutT (NUDIX family)
MTIERHFTATAYIVEQQKVLLLKHPKHQKWLPPGGHVETNETPPSCAIREAKEETGLDIELVRQENLWIDCWNASSIERPFLCLLENIPPYGDKPAHQHIDMIFLARPTGGTLSPEARWFSLEEVERLTDDEEIFVETKATIRHILNEQGSTYFSSEDKFHTGSQQKQTSNKLPSCSSSGEDTAR